MLQWLISLIRALNSSKAQYAVFELFIYIRRIDLIVHDVEKKQFPGVLISFEGVDGVGKTTQIDFLKHILDKQSKKYICVREPGGTKLGEHLRSILLNQENANLSDRAELLLYEAARAQLVDEIIIPALENGDVVICDRFFDSSTAYQGYGRGLDIDFLNQVNLFATAQIVPDCTILLNPSNVRHSLNRAIQLDGADRIESEGVDFQGRVSQGFLEIAQQAPQRIHIVSSSGTRKEIAQNIMEYIVPLFDDLNISNAEYAFFEAFDRN